MWCIVTKSGWARTTLSCCWKSKQPVPRAFLCLLNNIQFLLHSCLLVGPNSSWLQVIQGVSYPPAYYMTLLSYIWKVFSRLMQYNAVTFSIYIWARRPCETRFFLLETFLLTPTYVLTAEQRKQLTYLYSSRFLLLGHVISTYLWKPA